MKITGNRSIRLTAAATLLLLSLPAAFAQGSGGAAAVPPLGPAQTLRLPQIVQRTLPSGIRLVLLEDHAQPAIWMRLALPAGAIRDPQNKVGLAQMAASLLDKGTATRTESQIADTVDLLGASLGASADDDYLFVSAQGLSPHADKLLELMADITLRPTFPQAEMDRYRTRTLSAITSSLAEPGNLANAAIARLVFGAHPYGNFSAGTRETLTTITQADLKAFHAAYFAPNEATVFVVGDITADQAAAKVEKAFAGWAKKTAPAAPAPPDASVPGVAPRPQITIIDRPGAAQTEIRIGTLARPYSDPQRVTGVVATAVLGLGNFEGRLTREIRVKRGLTYGVASFFTRNKQAGLFQVSTFTKNATTGEVVTLALGEADKLTKAPPTGEELQDRQSFLTGAFALGVATPSGVLTRLVPAVLFGSGPQELTTFSERVMAVTPQAVQQVIDGLPLERSRIVLVGDAKEIEPQVKALGDVTIISQDQVDLNSPTLRASAAQTAVGTTPATAEEIAAGRARLDAAIKAHGGEAFLNVTSLKITGKGELSPPGGGGTKIPLSQIILTTVAPDKSRLDMKSDFGDFAFASMGGEKGGWISAVGNIQTLPPSRSSSADPNALLIAAAKRRFAVRSLASAPPSAEGKKQIGFAVTNDKGIVTEFYIEEGTNLVRQLTSKGRQGESSTFLGGYKAVNGLQMPTTMRTTQNGADFLSMTFDTFEFNKPVEDTLFDKPKG